MCDDRRKTVAVAIFLHQVATINRRLYRFWVRFLILDVLETFRVDGLTFFLFNALFLFPNIDVSFRVDINNLSLKLQSP